MADTNVVLPEDEVEVEEILEPEVVRCVKITPRMAAKMLAKESKSNRSRSEVAVRKYTHDQCSGHWMYIPGDTSIKLLQDETVVDGAHRLTSVVRSGVSILCDIVYNFPPDLVRYLDIGKSRTLGDVLQVDGIPKYASGIASTINWGIRYDLDRWSNFAPSHSHAMEWYDYNTDVTDYVKYAWCNQFGKWTKSIVAITAYLVDRQCGDDTGLNFWEVYNTKKNLSDAQAIMMRWAENNLYKVERKSTLIQYGIVIKAMNAHILDQEVKGFRFVPKGKRSESFPRIEGETKIVTLDDIPDYIPDGWASMLGVADENTKEVSSGA